LTFKSRNDFGSKNRSDGSDRVSRANVADGIVERVDKTAGTQLVLSCHRHGSSPQLWKVDAGKATVSACLPVLAVVQVDLSAVHLFQPAHSTVHQSNVNTCRTSSSQQQV